MSKQFNSIYKFFSITSVFCMFWAISTTIFSPRIGVIFSLYRAEHSYKVIILLNIFCIILSCLIFLSVKFFSDKLQLSEDLNEKRTYIVLFVELLIYSLLILIVIKFIGFVNPVDDTRITLSHLNQLEQGNKLGFDYMYSNPQNIFLMYFFRILRTLFGESYLIIIVSFIVLHCSTILFTFLSLKNMQLTNKLSLIIIQIFFFALQITLHVPVAYTDILSLFFISASVYFFTKFTFEKTFSETKTNLIYIVLTCIFAALGFISKGTVLIFIIALSVFLFFYGRKWYKFLSLLPFLIMIMFNFGWNKFIQHENIFPDDNYGQPNTHYIMMGLSHTPIPDSLNHQQKSAWSVGVYDSDDQAYSWNLFLKQRLPKKDIQNKQLAIASQRWRALSVKEKFEVLNNKASVTWGSGDLKSSFEWKLGVNQSYNRLDIFTNKKTGLILYCWMMVIQYIVYIGIILTTIKYFYKKNIIVFFSNIYISGYFFFLLIWESSPRYSMGIFIPAIIMVGELFSNLQGRKTSKDTCDLKID